MRVVEQGNNATTNRREIWKISGQDWFCVC